MDQTFGSFI